LTTALLVMQRLKEVEISTVLSDGSKITIWLSASSEVEHLCQIDMLEAEEFGEAEIQIKEGHQYEYKITEGFELKGNKKIFKKLVYNRSAGLLTPGNYVGTLNLPFGHLSKDEIEGCFQIEVQSVKANYRTDYRLMLEDIAEKCAELVMQLRSPVSQFFKTDPLHGSKTIYQRFCFLKSILNSEELENAVSRMLWAPTIVWEDSETLTHVTKIKRLSSRQLRQLHGIHGPAGQKILAFSKKETVDSPVNRFIKFAFTQFLELLMLFNKKLNGSKAQQQEVLNLIKKLHGYLGHSLFKEVGNIDNLSLNSPVLQRKEGYREILRAWLMFDLAAQLTWAGGNDVYEGGKKDIAALYEYWVFFKLIDILVEVFRINRPQTNDLIESTSNGLELKLKQGKLLSIVGILDAPTRKFHVQFSYNRTFASRQIYPKGGSWSTALRPDFTVSIWPWGVSSDQAEREELIVHIHFDAKYKIGHPQYFFDNEDDQDKNNVSSNYNNDDLKKMHVYRDAIRRTAGAYILYPGDKSEEIRGFHELLPGIGAFSIYPSRGDDGTFQLKEFFRNIVEMLLNRTSQRERMALKTYEIHRSISSGTLKKPMPELLGVNRSLHPEEVTVLVGYYKDAEHLKWIIKSNLYNTRINTVKGSINLSGSITSAKYLLLHNKDQKESDHFFKLSADGPKIFSQKELMESGYPSTPSQSYYLIFEIVADLESEFCNQCWDVSRLKGYKTEKDYALPFATNLVEIMEIMTAKF